MTTEEGMKKAEELNVMYFETSAKAGYNVQKVRRLNIYFLKTLSLAF